MDILLVWGTPRTLLVVVAIVIVILLMVRLSKKKRTPTLQRTRMSRRAKMKLFVVLLLFGAVAMLLARPTTEKDRPTLYGRSAVRGLHFDGDPVLGVSGLLMMAIGATGICWQIIDARVKD